MKIVVSHPTGNQNLRAIVNALANDGLLGEFHTAIAVDPGAFWLRLLPPKYKNEFSGVHLK